MARFDILKTVELYFGRIDVYDLYMVVTPHREIDRQTGDLYEQVVEISSSSFTEPWGYIGNRVSGNPSDPSLLARARMENPLWCSFAVVAYSKATVNCFRLESMALQGFPNGLFHDLDAAIKWTDETVRTARGGVVRQPRLQS
ncbi:hypothetical protein [Pelagicoccus sp. SDUM812002]|uniref:hypothetical protein n=1 Tax=Pelagicoccus sp. SDUM812002 TaxID=3041266 RepID=UPI00280C9857|nr:hypothetical protein [Pelagicoccus sp. SDUM812002]MDQ8185103.1 hypothetical protein [Pelagicoccus sp. SDUM812002]